MRSSDTVLSYKVPAHEAAPLLRANHHASPDGTRQPGHDSTSAQLPQTGSKTANQEAVPAIDAVASLKPFPVVVFSHGLAGMRTVCSGLCCDLASHGYVVASVEHRDQSACVSNRRVLRPDGAASGRQLYKDDWLPFYYRKETEEEFPLRNRQVQQRAYDVKCALDLLILLNEGGDVGNMMDADFDFTQFKGRIDVGKAAVMGHSFGGATTVQTLSEDPRFSCGIALDTWMPPIHRDLYDKGLQRPLLFINSGDGFQWMENVQLMMKLSQAPDKSGKSACRVLTLRNTNHASQTDIVFLLPFLVMRRGKYQPAMDLEAFSLNMEISHAFLRRHLISEPNYLQPVPNLDGLTGHSPDVVFGTNLDEDSVSTHKPLPKL